jgi:hypothetical protein
LENKFDAMIQFVASSIPVAIGNDVSAKQVVKQSLQDGMKKEKRPKRAVNHPSDLH